MECKGSQPRKLTVSQPYFVYFDTDLSKGVEDLISGIGFLFNELPSQFNIFGIKEKLQNCLKIHMNMRIDTQNNRLKIT